MSPSSLRNLIIAASACVTTGLQAQSFVPGGKAVFDAFDPNFTSLGAGTFAGTAFTFATGASPTLANGTTTYTGQYFTVDGRQLAFFTFDSINISTNINGGSAANGLVLLSRSGVSLSNTTINLNGTNAALEATVGTAGGAGGFSGGNGLSTSTLTGNAGDGGGPMAVNGGQGSQGTGAGNAYASGGGGANGGAGGQGITTNAANAPISAGGVAYGTDASTFTAGLDETLSGGAGGGGGLRIGSESNRGLAGAGGGGFLQIVAGSGAISIENTVVINANGGNGAGSASNNRAGGGGGAGGTVSLAAVFSTIDLASGASLAINANGGNGADFPAQRGGNGGGGRVGLFSQAFTTPVLDTDGSEVIGGISISTATGTTSFVNAPATVGTIYLAAVPEPSSVAVAFGLLAGVIGLSRRRKA